MLEAARIVTSRPLARRLVWRDPGDISGLRVWLEADHGVEEVAGRISAWRDRSGRGNDAVQATAANKPLYTTNNGRPSINVDDIQRFLQIPKGSTDIEPGAGAAVYCVVQSTSTVSAGGGGIWGLWGSAAAGNVWLGVANDVGIQTQGAGYISETGTNTNRSARTTGDCTDGVDNIVSLHWSGSAVAAAKNGASAGTTACAGAKTASATTGNFVIGRYQGSGDAIVGHYRALLIIQRPGGLAIGGAEDVFIRDYLRRRWGTP